MEKQIPRRSQARRTIFPVEQQALIDYGYIVPPITVDYSKCKLISSDYQIAADLELPRFAGYEPFKKLVWVSHAVDSAKPESSQNWSGWALIR